MKHFRILAVLLISVGLLTGCGAKGGPEDGAGDAGTLGDAGGAGMDRPGGGAYDLNGGGGGMGGDLSAASLNGQPGYEHIVFFDLNSSSLIPEAEKVLINNVKWIQGNRHQEVVIEGHCDERGTREFNLALGQQRADAVRRFLMGQGLDGSRIRTVSYGKEKPMMEGHDDSAWAHNRRAEIVLR